jgi:hypothetical protein
MRSAVGIGLAVMLAACVNPFTPGLADGDILDDILGNPTSIEGFYTRFQNAYQFRDTTLYGPLIHPNFIFTHRDPDLNVDVTWGRTEDLNSTARLFASSRDIQLQWNNIITRFENAANTEAQVIRRFNLSVRLTDNQTFRTDGATNFRLIRSDSTQAWQLLSWRDESDL